MSGGFASSGFEILNQLDRRAFPTARRNRTGPAPASAQALDVGVPLSARPPQARVWSFFLRETLLRATAFSPRFTPPLLLKTLAVVGLTGAAGVAAGLFQLSYSTTLGVTGANQTLDPGPVGTRIIESSNASDNETFAGEGGIYLPASTLAGGPVLLDYWISENAPVFLAATLRNTLGPEYFGGVVTLYEAVQPSDWPSLIG